MNIIEKLTHPIFKDFTLTELESLLAVSKIVVFRENDVLIHEDALDRNIYIILEGKVRVTTQENVQDGVVTLAILGSENVLGEISVLTGRPRSATVTAEVETTTLMIDIPEIEKRADLKPIYEKLRKNLTEELSKKIIYTRNKFVQAEPEDLGEMELPENIPNSILVLFGWRWLDIMYEVPFLAAQGYDAIKISPPQEFVVRTGSPWWCAYQPVSYQLSQYYGSKADFKKMIDLCHSFDIKVYADLLLDHTAEYCESEKIHAGTNGTEFSKYHYGPLNADNDYYEFDDFYHFSPEDNLKVTNEDYCKLERFWHLEHFDLLNLPKLNLEHSSVIKILRKYVKTLLSFGIDGFRIDAAKHLNVPSVEKILSDLRTNAGEKLFIYQEYYAGLPMGIDVYSYMEKYFKIGYVTSFNYGQFLSDAIQNKNNDLGKLVQFSFGSSWIHYPENRTVVVLDNHDTERMMPSILNYKCTEHNAYVLAYIFMLAWPFGIPKIMSSFRFSGMDDAFPTKPVWENGRNTGFDSNSPWICQHRWGAICNMVLFRQKTQKATGVTHVWTNGNQVAFARSYQKPKAYVKSLGFVVINDTSKPLKRKFETGLPAGKYFDLISCQLEQGKMKGLSIDVKNYGFAEIEIKPFDALCICIDFME